MNAETFNNLRVVVHINEDTPEYQNQNVNAKKGRLVDPAKPNKENPEFDHMKAEITLIDDKSLQLNLISTEDDEVPYRNISHKMHFNHVCQSTVETIKCELCVIMDVLLLKRKNTCVMHFAIKPEMNIILFFDLLINNINKMLYHQKQKLQCVKLEFLQIAANLQNCEFSCVEKGLTTSANLRSDANCNNGNRTASTLPNYAKKQFRTTRDLLLWLANEYQQKFANSNAHEKLQFSFSIVDHHKRLFKVKLILFNIFVNLMNTENRNHWQHYVDHVGNGCKGFDCKFVHSDLTLNLYSYIEGTASGNTILLFDVPTSIQTTADTIEMLQMAHSVVKNKTRALLSIKTGPQSDKKCISPQRCKELRNSYKKERRSSLPVFLEHQSKGDTVCETMYTSEDFNTLSCWYRKIDKCFEINVLLREKYFNHYFKINNKQILSNVKNMLKVLESPYIQQNQTDLIELQEDQTELSELFKNYDNVRRQFHKFTQDIKNTGFERILKVYLATKTFDLNKQAQVLIQKHLIFCQEHLNFAFDNLYSKIELEFEF